MRWYNGSVVGSFETLINPGRPMAEEAFAVTGITEEMLASAPIFKGVAPELLEAIDRGVIVAHNAPFDVCFLNTELLQAGFGPLHNVVVDTLALARAFLRQDRYNLGALAQGLGLERPSHRAMSDVQALIAVFDHLLRRLESLGVETLEDLVRAQRGILPGEPEPTADPLILDALRHGKRLRIAYRTNGGEPIMRDILPIELSMSNGLPRLVAYCFLRNAQRTFYLDRIAELLWAAE